jgi:hypothetical protein
MIRKEMIEIQMRPGVDLVEILAWYVVMRWRLFHARTEN